MTIENLNTQELEMLRTLLNKMAVEPKIVKVDKTEAMINDIIEEFDFDKVQSAMEHLCWKWRGEDVTIDMLKETAIELLKDASKSRLNYFKDSHWQLGITCGTGGLQATACCDEDKTKITNLDLKFVLEEWDVDLEDVNNN
jgi:hypothetical protein